MTFKKLHSLLPSGALPSRFLLQLEATSPARRDDTEIFKMILAMVFLGFAQISQAQFCPENFDGAAAPGLPASWSAYVITGAVSPWKSNTSNADTPPNAAFAADPASVSDNVLASPDTIVTAANSTFYFRHSYKTETNLDGGVLEISINDGGFVDLVTAGGSFTDNGYNSTISSSFGSPIAGRAAWSGDSGGFVTTGVVLPPSATGNFVSIRWRAASDSSVASTGWFVDSIVCGPPPQFWSLDAPYPIAIAGQSTATVGKALFSFGGLTTGDVTTSSAFRFNGSAWTAIAPLPVAVGYPAVAADGQYVYIVGGANSSGTVFASGFRYQPATNTYTNIAPTPTARWNSAAVYLNGRLYKIGGANLTNGGSGTTAVEVYNVANNSWSNVSPYPVAVQFASAFVRNQFIYVAGGATTPKAYRYDPVADVWDDAALADLPQIRYAAAGANFHSTFLLAGGYGTVSTATSVVQWDPATNVWLTIPHMLVPRVRLNGGTVNGCFFAIGGQAPNTTVYRSENQKLDCISYDGFEP